MIKKYKRNKIMCSLCRIYYKDYREKINLYTVKDEAKLPYEEIIQIAINLESQGYLKYLSPKEVKETKILKDGKLTYVYKPHSEQAFVSLTDDGKCYFEVNSDKKIEFIRKSIITPILVSIATTLLVNWLPDWLPQILTWAQLYLNF